jgi:5'-nucleotidase
MRILVTNDDGIGATGLNVLEQVAQELSTDVWAVAPNDDCSDGFSAPTIGKPLELKTLGAKRYSLKGTPTDCVIVGVRCLLVDSLPNVLLCGVNRGENLSDDIYHSSTVMGAIQGTLLGIPSISISLVTGESKAKWDSVRQHGAHVLRTLLKRGWPPDVLLNVNFPDCTPDFVKGVLVTQQGRRDPAAWAPLRKLHNKGTQEVCTQRRKSEPQEESDLWAIQHGCISVTPICVDLTKQQVRTDLAASFTRPNEAKKCCDSSSKKTAPGTLS